MLLFLIKEYPTTLAFKQPAPLVFNAVKEPKRGLPLQNRNDWPAK